MPPKNFDTARQARADETREEREFVLGGQTFHARLAVRPEVLTRWNDIDSAMDLEEVLKIADEVVLALIENEEDTPSRYAAVRASEDDPVSLADLLDVAKWLVEVQTGRPIEAPSVSGDLSPTTPPSGTDSTDDSSSTDTQTESADSTSVASATSSTPPTPS